MSVIHVPDGFVLVDKPAGMSSHSAVQAVRRTLGIGGKRGVKAGHAGTLDPFATGLLIVMIGGGTRLMPWVVGQDKRYEVVVSFGISSDTDDITGTIVSSPAGCANSLSAERLHDAVEHIASQKNQVPPAVSAIHIDGQRAYARVRKGERVVIPPRPVVWHDIELTECDLGADPPTATLDVHCGSGAYIRSLARDLGSLLECGGLASSLRRTAIGSWTIDDAHKIDDLSAENIRPLTELIPASMPVVEVMSSDLAAISNGRAVVLEQPPAAGAGSVAAVVGDLVVAIGEISEDRVDPSLVLHRTIASVVNAKAAT